jgi:hypothetical protein
MSYSRRKRGLALRTATWIVEPFAPTTTKSISTQSTKKKQPTNQPPQRPRHKLSSLLSPITTQPLAIVTYILILPSLRGLGCSFRVPSYTSSPEHFYVLLYSFPPPVVFISAITSYDPSHLLCSHFSFLFVPSRVLCLAYFFLCTCFFQERGVSALNQFSFFHAHRLSKM